MNTNNNNKHSKWSIGEIAVVILIVLSILFLGKVLIGKLTFQVSPTCETKKVLAVEGDTMWDIVKDNCLDHSRTGETVSIAIRMNGGSAVHPGQIVWLPASPLTPCVPIDKITIDNNHIEICAFGYDK